MSENTIKFKKGVSLVPQSSDPANPQEGDVFYSDGTSRAKGLWAYDGSTWIQADSTGGGGSSIEVEDEGVSLTTAVTKFNFTGAGVTATQDANVVTVDIPSGAAAGMTYSARLDGKSAPTTTGNRVYATNDGGTMIDTALGDGGVTRNTPGKYTVHIKSAFQTGVGYYTAIPRTTSGQSYSATVTNEAATGFDVEIWNASGTAVDSDFNIKVQAGEAIIPPAADERSAVWTPNSTYGFLSSTLGTASQIAFSAWIYLPSSSVSTQEIFTVGRTTPTNGLLLTHNGVDTLTFAVSAKTATISGITFNDSWYHVGFIFNGSASPQYNAGADYGRAFLNGTASANAAGGGGNLINITNSVVPNLGGGASAFFDGSFANAHIFLDKGLTAADMASLAGAGYYTDPNTVIGKTANHGYLFGDVNQVPVDTTTVVYDRIGSNDIDFNFGGNPARNIASFSTDIP